MPTRAADNGGIQAVGKRVLFKDVGEKGLMKNSCIESISCSGESSSIGRDSDASETSMEKSGDCEEVQSSFKDPFDAAVEALEEVLPIRRGISRFYKGKSKSFASLADTPLSSTKELAKPDNMYMRRRRNLLACNGGGISKRVTGSTRPTLALALALNNSDTDNSSAGSLLVSSSVKDFSSWRSFSLVDLQQFVSSVGKCREPNRLVTKPC